MTRRTFLASASLAVKDSGKRWLLASVEGPMRSESWPEMQRAVSMGSLLKPFLGLAYFATHSCAPKLTCNGTNSGCWLPHGHGPQDFVGALANSCNAYFLRMTDGLDRAALDRICLQYGLLAPERDWPSSRLIGLREGWPQVPAQVAQAFGMLCRERVVRGVDPVLAGMRRCAVAGTGRGIGWRCYAKTGTAVCHHLPPGAGDGYVAALYPVESPRLVLLLQEHNKTGAQAAAKARELLRVLG